MTQSRITRQSGSGPEFEVTVTWMQELGRSDPGTVTPEQWAAFASGS